LPLPASAIDIDACRRRALSTKLKALEASTTRYRYQLLRQLDSRLTYSTAISRRL